MSIYACIKMAFCCKGQITDSNLRMKSLVAAWFQNCLIQWWLIPVLSHLVAPPSSAYWSTLRLVHLWSWHNYSSPASNPDTATTKDCWFLHLFLLEQEIFPSSLLADFPSHQASLAKLPMNIHRPTPKPTTGNGNSGATMTKSDQPWAHFPGGNYPGEEGG